MQQPQLPLPEPAADRQTSTRPRAPQAPAAERAAPGSGTSRQRVGGDRRGAPRQRTPAAGTVRRAGRSASRHAGEGWRLDETTRRAGRAGIAAARAALAAAAAGNGMDRVPDDRAGTCTGSSGPNTAGRAPATPSAA